MNYVRLLNDRLSAGEKHDIRKLKSLPDLCRYLDGGIYKESFVMIVGGASYSGKSILLRTIATDLFETDATVLYFSLDEGPMQTLRFMVSMTTGVPYQYVRKPYNAWDIALNPSYGFETKKVKQYLQKKIESSMKYITTLINEKRFYLINEIANSIAQISMIIEDAMKYNGNIVVCIDSFQQLNPDTYESQGAASIAANIRYISNTYNIPIIILSEVNKPASTRRPTTEDLSDTRKLEFNSDVVLLAYNSEKSDGIGTNSIRIDNIGDPYIDAIANKNTMCPIIEYNIHKNRISDLRGTFFMKVIPWCVKLDTIDASAIQSSKEDII